MHSRPRPTKPPRYPLLSGGNKHHRKLSFPNLLSLQEQPLLQHDPSELLSPSQSFAVPNGLQHSDQSDALSTPLIPWVIPRSISSAIPIVLFIVLVAVITTPLVVHLPPLLDLTKPDVSTLSPRLSPRPGIALIAACKDRHPMLTRAFVTWLRVALVRQIVFVDWSSSPPLRETLDALVFAHSSTLFNSSMPDIHVVRVEGESRWVLTRAYNLAASLARFDTIFKVDCDIVLHPDSISAHALPKNPPTFFSGHPALARDENQLYLSGQFITSRSLFLSVGGYDERIQTYGFEDVDLYFRLERGGARRFNLSYNYLTHVVHHETARTQAGVAFPSIQVDINAQLSKQVNDVWTVKHSRSEYKWAISNGKSDTVRAISAPPDLSNIVSAEAERIIRVSAFSDHLHREYFIPRVVVDSLSQTMKEKLLRNLIIKGEYAGLDRVLHPGDAPPIVIIHVQNGIGNRLRVLGSGLAFAATTDREPIVIWERDDHFGAVFSEIFNESSSWFPIIDEFPASWPLLPLHKQDEAWDRMILVNYMVKEDVGMIVEDVKGKNIYFKSSAIMNSDLTSWELENANILRLRFNDAILRLSDNMLSRLKLNKLGGVHIRNRSLDDDIPGLDDNRKFYYKEDMDLIDKWRKVTTVSNFIPTMRKLLKNETVKSFFVTSDSISVCKELQETFGNDVIHFIDRDCDDRGAICLRYAMADILVLTKTNPLLGSTWSSFTEAAMRLGGPKVLMAGWFFFHPFSKRFCFPITSMHLGLDIYLYASSVTNTNVFKTLFNRN